MAKVEIFKTKRPSQRRTIPESQAKVLVKMGKWSYATAALDGGVQAEAKPAPTRRKRVAPSAADAAPAPTPAPTPAEKPKPPRSATRTAEDDLSGVSFASPAAAEAARTAGLTVTAFKRQRKASERGFTAADVERIAAKQAAK